MSSVEFALEIARERFRLTGSEQDAQLCERLYKELKEIEKGSIDAKKNY